MAAWMTTPIQPMMATLTREPFDSPDHLFEVKWDGVRAIAFLGGATRLQARTLRDLSRQYPELLQIHKLISAKEAILDGEIVSLDAQGRPSFERLQQRMNLTRAPDIEQAAREYPVLYYAFDLLYLDGRPLTGLPLTERRDQLEALAFSERALRLSHTIDTEGTAFFQAAVSEGLEGIMAKRKASTYQMSRRSRDWLKIKHVRRQEFVVGGWTEGQGARSRSFGSLILGLYEDGRLVPVGQVGSGFDERTLRELLQLLRERETDGRPFAEEPVTLAATHWTSPELVCEVEFTEWTSDGKLRNPSFKGLRWDKNSEECRREEPR